MNIQLAIQAQQGTIDPILSKLLAMDIEEVGSAIKTPPKEWPLRCFEIACKIVVAFDWTEDAQAVYGMFYGEIHPDSPFFPRRNTPIRHGWIVTKAGAIVDPTAWVFSASKPRLVTYWPGTDAWDDFQDGYDEGMEQMAAIMHKSIPFPRTDPQQKQCFLDSPHVLDRMSDMLKRRGFEKDAILTSYTPAQIGWLCRIPPSEWGFEFASELYSVLERHSLRGLVPMDYLTKVERMKKWGLIK